MNNIQRAPVEKHSYIFVTLNPPSLPSAKHVLGHYTYIHPVQSPDAVRAQSHVAQLNASTTESGQHCTFAGVWTGYGFYEHSFTAGLHAAAALPSVTLPFQIANADVECSVPCVGVVAYVFDVLDALRPYVAIIIGSILFFVAWTVWKKVD